MKRMRNGFRLVGAVALALGTSLPASWAQDGEVPQHKVGSKEKEVAKNDKIDFKDEEDSIRHKVVKTELNGGKWAAEINSKIFVPPEGFSFKVFPGSNTHVDIFRDPAWTIDVSRPIDEDKKIQIQGNFYLNKAAGPFPLRGEGNLEPPAGEKGEPPKLHWSARVKQWKVVLDPGHGGQDSGAVGVVLKEKDVNLKVGLQVKAALEKANVIVVMTRQGDDFIAPRARAVLTGVIKPDLFLSIHMNGVGNTAVNGTETIIPKDPINVEKAYGAAIQQSVQAVVNENNRGVKNDTRGLAVLNHQTNDNTDSALSEVTFISNPASEAKLNDPEFLTAVAGALTQAIIDILTRNFGYMP